MTILIAAFCVLSATILNGQQALSEPIGYNRVNCSANSNTILSVPFMDTESSFTGSVGDSVSIIGSDDNQQATLNLQQSVSFNDDQYAEMYFIRINSGNLIGTFFQIASNTSDTVTINLFGDDGTLLEEGDTFGIYKFWTISSLFPQEGETVIESSDHDKVNRMTEIRIYPRLSNRVIAADATVYYRVGNSWFNEENQTNADDVILWPDTGFIVRHTANVVEDTTYIIMGIPNYRLNSIPIITSSNIMCDNVISWPRPVPVLLKDMGLEQVIRPGESFSAANRIDTLTFIDPEKVGKLNSRMIRVHYNGTNWLRLRSDEVMDDLEVPAGATLLCRIEPDGNDDSRFWNIPEVVAE